MSMTLAGRVIALCSWVVFVLPLSCQVKPDQILSSRLKADETRFLPQLEVLQRSIQAQHFIFPFRLSRYVNARPGQKGFVDADGIEFVYFKGVELLKISGVYEAAYSASSLSENERAAQTLQQVIDPVLRASLAAFPEKQPGDGIGFEIVYNSRDSERTYDYEGHEVITAVFSWQDAISYAQSRDAEERQDILNRSDIYVNGKAFGLALLQRNPFPVESLERSVPRHLRTVEDAAASEKSSIKLPRQPVKLPALTDASSAIGREEASTGNFVNAANEQMQFKQQLYALTIQGREKLHLDPNAPLAFEAYGDQVALHITLLNPLSYQNSTPSIYKRSAQGFDLVVAPELNSILGEIPGEAQFSMLRFTLIGKDEGNTKDEVIDYICPLDAIRSLTVNTITSQDLIDRSIVMVNGVRIRINLQLVE